MNTSSRKSSPRNPKELVDRYLQAVRFWLPKSRRQEDLIAELGEDLHSQVEEKEIEQGRPLDQEEVSAILKRCGNPMIVATRLGPKRFLIGPTLFPIYQFVLKMVLLWIMVPVFIFIVGPVNLATTSGDLGPAIFRTFGNLWSGVFISAGIITLVFAVLERTHAQMGSECKWDPLSLPPLQKQERKTSLAHTVCELVFGWFGVIWLLLLPHYPVLILGPAAAFLKAGAMWHTFYVPIVILAAAALLRPGITLARPQWSWFPPAAQLLQTILSLVVLRLILNAATQTSGGDWQPFVVLTDAARNSPQYIRVAAIVNVSILVSLASAWIGLSIAGIVQTWLLMRYFYKRNSATPQAASINVL
jgi:hypothetical protein